MAEAGKPGDRVNEVIGELAPRGGDRLYRSAIAQTAASQTRLLAECLTAAEAADRLGIPAARMRRMLRRRELVATKAAGRWLVLPSQFDGSRLVRNISVVAQALPADLALLGAANWLALPNSDLELSDRPVSPLQWLRAGGDPEVAAELARDL